MRDPAPDSPQSLSLRLVHAARSFEASGSYNAAKLLWALAYSEEIRGSAAAAEAVTREGRDRQMQALIPALRAAGTGEAILSALERGRLAALEDRTIPLKETAQSLLAGRVDKIHTQDMASLEGVAAWAVGASEVLAAGEILARYRGSRHATVDRLASIPGQDWWRLARHSESGVVSLLQQASYFARHDASHLSQIDAIRAAMGA